MSFRYDEEQEVAEDCKIVMLFRKYHQGGISCTTPRLFVLYVADTVLAMISTL
jgi:hypothetical protein